MNNQIQLVLKSSTTELSLNDHELGIYLVPELDGLTGLPEIRTTSGVNSGYDGGWTSAQHYDARSITIRGVIANTDVATVERLRKQLVSLAGQGKQEELTLDLVTEAGNAYTLQVHTIALEMAMKGVLEKQEFMLQLRADDPLIYDNAESTHDAYIQVSKATGGFTIDFNLPLAITGGSEETVISNDGLEQVPTITRLYGELHNPKIINQTTNQSMQINADVGFSEGQWVDASEVVTGKTINIEDVPDNAPLASFRLDGETSQNGTPTPDAPVAVQTVTGENVVKICGKNLLPTRDNYTYTNNGVTFTADGEGFTLNGTATANADFYISGAWGNRTISYGHLTAGTYRLSVFDGSFNSMPSSPFGVNIYDRFGENSRSVFGSAPATANLSADRDITAVYITVRSGTTFNNERFYVQLEKSSTTTDFEPYQGQSYPISLGSIELCKLGDYQDSIYKSGDKWYVHKAVGEVVLDGSETWTGQSMQYLARYQTEVAGVLAPQTSTDIPDAISNYFAVMSPSAIWGLSSGAGFSIVNGTDVIRIANGDTTADVASFKTWLASHPTAIYYALATPTDTEITNEALIAQLDTLLNTARTYAGVNNITTITPNEQGTLEISYYTHKTADNRDEIVIDSRLRTVTLNGLDIYHLIETGSEFLMLAPGENKLSLQSDITGDNGYAEVSYKQGYLSI